MNTPLSINIRAVKRMFYVMLAGLLVVAGLPLIQGGQASADQLQNRSIQLSDSGPSGTSITSGIGSGTAVTYQVSFLPGPLSANNAGSMVIDFCSNDPIIDDTCTAPTGMDASAAVLNATAQHGTVDTTHNWVVTASASQIKLADDDPTGGSDDLVHATNQIFDLSGITNPAAPAGSFYARIYTYHNTNTWGTYAGASGSPGPGNFVDYGGIALSTATTITITARVQETLTFCVTAADPNAWTTTGGCDDTAVSSNPPNIILGHGSPTAVLDNLNVDTASVYTQLSTNATNGAVINMHGSTTCGGLSADGGVTCAIPPVNAGTGVSGGTAITAGTAAFGLNVETFTPTTPPAGSTGSVTPAPFYYNASHNTVTGSPPDLWYGMDNTTASGANVSPVNTYTGAVGGAFGSTTATTAGPLYKADNQYVFAATAALTTPAGIYTVNESLIATCTF